ncbi:MULTISPECIES: ABC transporter permease [Streptomyces]|uniref:ABC transporter permease n=1 Tax=Streptomyces TaxID=1883 RepID=UPI0015908DB2|nr:MULTISPECIES: ABC transporter permease subunit [Streptomyces]QKV69455.1 ABC transporter permease subunit [Streptomyces harbinensis]
MNALTGAWSWLTTAAHWSGDGGITQRLGEHLYLTALALLAACAIALPLAMWLGHGGGRRVGGALAINISNAGRAVPTFAVLVLLTLTPLARYGELPTLIALVLFSVPPLLTNAYVGIAGTDRDIVQAARGMGMSRWQVLGRVELPLAFPMLMTGVRTAAVQIVATATLAALPGGGGLGRVITAGFANYRTAQVVAGAVLVAVLALAVEGLLALLQRLLDPTRPGRRRAGAAPAAGDVPPGPHSVPADAAEAPART